MKLKRKFARICYSLSSFWEDIIYVYPDNIKRIIRFIPALWKDWNFDASPGLYRIMKVKLQALERCLRNGHLEGGPEHADTIVCVMEALDRLIADEYDLKALKSVDAKWGKTDIYFVPCENNCYEMKNRIEDNLTEEQKVEFRGEQSAAFDAAYRTKETDIELVFNTIRDEHLKWWD